MPGMRDEPRRRSSTAMLPRILDVRRAIPSGTSARWRRTRRTGAVVLALLALLVGDFAAAQDPGPAASTFRVEWERRTGFWRPAIEGYVYNQSEYRIGNVRLRITVVDATGKPLAEKTGWVYGAIDAGGRGHFVLPLPESGQTYTIVVDSFDLLARQPQSP
jgi:hypothetical protein